MTTSVVDQIIQVIEYLGLKFGIAIDWSSEKLVPIAEHIAESYISWEITTSILWLSLGVVALVMGTTIAILIGREFDRDEVDEILLWVCVIIAFAGLVVSVCQGLDIIKCLTFPELKIVEYIQSFMQQ